MMTLQASQSQPFSWGTHDCCLFAADCAVAICGKDPAQLYRGTYSTEQGAKRALIKHHGSIMAAFDACFEQLAPTHAQRGDLVLFESPLGQTVGVVWASAIWAVGKAGVGVVERPNVSIAWRVE